MKVNGQKAWTDIALEEIYRLQGNTWKDVQHHLSLGKCIEITVIFNSMPTMMTKEKEMATHSSVTAWRIPGRGSLVGCYLWALEESDMTSHLSTSTRIFSTFFCKMQARHTHFTAGAVLLNETTRIPCLSTGVARSDDSEEAAAVADACAPCHMPRGALCSQPQVACVSDPVHWQHLTFRVCVSLLCILSQVLGTLLGQLKGQPSPGESRSWDLWEQACIAHSILSSRRRTGVAAAE